MTRFNESVGIAASADIVTARQVARHISREIGYRTIDQTRLATAVSELARNILHYAGSGVCHINGKVDGCTGTVTIIAEDNGPGIADIDLALTDGYSSGDGLGAGLPGTRRLMDRFQIESRPGLTRITTEMARQLR